MIVRFVLIQAVLYRSWMLKDLCVTMKGSRELGERSTALSISAYRGNVHPALERPSLTSVTIYLCHIHSTDANHAVIYSGRQGRLLSKRHSGSREKARFPTSPHTQASHYIWLLRALASTPVTITPVIQSILPRCGRVTASLGNQAPCPSSDNLLHGALISDQVGQ